MMCDLFCPKHYIIFLLLGTSSVLSTGKCFILRCVTGTCSCLDERVINPKRFDRMADLQTIHQQSNYLVSVAINLEKHVPYAYKGGNRRIKSPGYVRDAHKSSF